MYWGKVTADYDWCERNYVVTPYIAEFWNCISSVGVLLAGIYFLRRSLRFSYGRRFHFASVGVAIIGLGSILFHGTLQRWGQVLDEVPMLWSSLIFLWIACVNNMDGCAENRWGTILGWSLFVLGIVSTYIYLLGGFAYFIVVYIITVIGVFGATLYQLRKDSPARRYAFMAVGYYSGGFLFLWLPEQLLCGNRKVSFHESGLLSLPIPLHAFFHLTSSIGPVCCLTYLTFEYLEQRKRNPSLMYERAAEFLGTLDMPLVKASPVWYHEGQTFTDAMQLLSQNFLIYGRKNYNKKNKIMALLFTFVVKTIITL